MSRSLLENAALMIQALIVLVIMSVLLSFVLSFIGVVAFAVMVPYADEKAISQVLIMTVSLGIGLAAMFVRDHVLK